MSPLVTGGMFEATAQIELKIVGVPRFRGCSGIDRVLCDMVLGPEVLGLESPPLLWPALTSTCVPEPAGVGSQRAWIAHSSFRASLSTARMLVPSHHNSLTGRRRQQIDSICHLLKF